MRNQCFTMRGTQREEYLRYFEAMGGSRAEADGGGTRVHTPAWSVVVGPEMEVRMGSLRFPEVAVAICCDEDIFDAFIRDYRLKFMTAGG